MTKMVTMLISLISKVWSSDKLQITTNHDYLQNVDEDGYIHIWPWSSFEYVHVDDDDKNVDNDDVDADDQCDPKFGVPISFRLQRTNQLQSHHFAS